VRAKVEVSGINELLRDLQRVADAGEETVAYAVEQLAETTAEIARAKISGGAGAAAPGSYPKSKTGRLEGSISVVLTQAKRTTAMVGTAQLHGRFLEFGTAKMEPRPWLMPSVEDAIPQVVGTLRAEFEGRI
jgi:HK97 gp10 family phage protein